MRSIYTLKIAAICLIAVLLAILLNSVATIAQQAGSTPTYGGTLVIGIASEPPNLVLTGDPTFSYFQIIAPICNSLVRFDPKTFEWRPDLAESWQIVRTNDSKMLVIFYLVKNATWHDGVPFTAQDVKFSYEKVGPVFNSFIAGMWRYLEGIDTPDNYTVVFRFNATLGSLLNPGFQYFGGPGTCISPKHLYEGTDILTNPYNTKPVGTGPFRFKEWVKGQYIVLERNENYWRKGLPYLDKIIYKVIPSSEARMLAFQKGEIDYIWAYGLSYPNAVQLESMIKEGKLPGKVALRFPSFGSATLGFNLNPNGPEPLKDVRVRKAIAMAINRSAIAEIAYFGWAAPLDTIVSNISPATAMYYPDAKEPGYNPDEANRLLDEAGYKRGPDGIRFKLRLVTDTTTFGWHVKEAELIRDFLKDVGIDVQIIGLDTATFLQTVFVKRDFDMFLITFAYGPGIRYFIQYLTRIGNVTAPWSNAMGYDNPEATRLLLDADKELDRSKQIELTKQALNIIVNDQPAVWTVMRYLPIFVSAAVSDELEPGALQYGLLNIVGVEKLFLRSSTPTWIQTQTMPAITIQPTSSPSPTQIQTPVQTQTEGATGAGATPTWIFMAAVIAIIIIVVIALLYVFRFRR